MSSEASLKHAVESHPICLTDQGGATAARQLLREKLSDLNDRRPVSTCRRNSKFFLNEVIRKTKESILLATAYDEDLKTLERDCL